MAESINKRRRSSRGEQTNVEQLVADDPVAALMAVHLGMIDRQEYLPLGQVLKMQVAAPQKTLHLGVLKNTGTGRDIPVNQTLNRQWLEFPKQNFHLGRLPDGMIDAVTPWPGMKDRIEPTDELCPECATTCDECGRGYSVPRSWDEMQYIAERRASGEPEEFLPSANKPCAPGRRPCRACGGIGKYRTGGTLCTHPNMVNGQCPDCRGTNELPVWADCQQCEKGEIQCPNCLGTGKMSTGFLNGQVVKMRSNVPSCPDCEGRGRVIKRIPQVLTLTEDSKNSYLGPVYAIMLKPSGEKKEPEIWTASADLQGDFPHFVSQDKFAAGTRVCVIGGVLTKVA